VICAPFPRADLDRLRPGSGRPKQDAGLRIVEHLREAACGADHAPGDAIARPASGRRAAPDTTMLPGSMCDRHHDVLEEDRTVMGGAQREFLLDLGCDQAVRALSTRKPRMPSSVCAQITNRSAIGELVIHIFAPFSTHRGRGGWRGLHVGGSEPPCGSVSPKQRSPRRSSSRGSSASAPSAAVGVDRDMHDGYDIRTHPGAARPRGCLDHHDLYACP